MNHSNAFSHLTLEERRIILTGISNGSTKSAIAKTIGKDRSTVAKEIRLHRTLSISVRCLSNATIIANVFMAASALLTAPNTLLSAAPDVTALLVPATAVPTGLAAASTSSATPRKMRTWITVRLWWTPAEA